MKKQKKSEKFELLDDLHESRSSFYIGETILTTASYLKPKTSYSIEVKKGRRLLFNNIFISDRNGNIQPTILWPQFGMVDPFKEKAFTIREALKIWEKVRFSVSLVYKKKTIRRVNFVFDEQIKQTLVLATDKSGRLCNGFEFGQQPLYVTLANLPKAFSYRIALVSRQHDWRINDSYKIVQFANGKPAVKEFKSRRKIQTILFADNNNVLPGAYDFIIRPLIYGYEDNEAPYIIERDILNSRLTTGLVVRENFWTSKPILGGCINKLPISGRSISGTPYFRYGNTFEVGEDIWAALDPGIVDPENISKMCALYVIPSKTASQWNWNNTLNHLPILGGNSGVIKFQIQPGCTNINKRLLWAEASIVGEYDIVADFGNNVPDISSFVPDGTYDTPLDIIDGYFAPGFRVVKDPGIMEDYEYIGNWNYDEGGMSVQDELYTYHSPNTFATTNWETSIKANVYFPADISGVTNPDQISSTKTDYPLIVIIHGAGHHYKDYDFLLEHFARNGFIAASIYLESILNGLGRANIFFEHYNILKSAFGAKVQNNIGIMGHSRGGEAVLKIARLNQINSVGININAIIALAPTDQYGSESLRSPYNSPYFVLYGSRDGDVNGSKYTHGYTVPQTGFAQYDRSQDQIKTMVFVYRATHNGFITYNSDGPYANENPNDLLDPAIQKTISKSYMNAFFRQHLMEEPIWKGIFTGEWKPASVEQTGAELHVQYKDPEGKIIDDFEGAINNWQFNSIGGTVTHNNTLPKDPDEDILHQDSSQGLDDKSPHESKGLLIKWDNSNDELVFNIPETDKDVTSYSHLSFRIAQKEASCYNIINETQKLRVALKDGNNKMRAIRVSTVSTIPFPDQRAQIEFRKSAMHTVRIPLTSYTIVCAGLEQVDLKNLISLSFIFTSNTGGEIEIDTIEFTN